MKPEEIIKKDKYKELNNLVLICEAMEEYADRKHVSITDEIVKKLIGPIRPVGDSNIDRERYENLISLTKLVEKLIDEIDSVVYSYPDSKEFSVRRICDFGISFLVKIGIRNA